jgi:hypothetical protein
MRLHSFLIHLSKPEYAHSHARLTNKNGWIETAAFGYLRERLFFEQRVRRPLAIRDIAPSFVNGERRSRALNSRRGPFVPDLLKFQRRAPNKPLQQRAGTF